MSAEPIDESVARATGDRLTRLTLAFLGSALPTEEAVPIFDRGAEIVLDGREGLLDVLAELGPIKPGQPDAMRAERWAKIRR